MDGIRQEERDGRFRLTLSGELDIAHARRLEDAVVRLCRAGALEIEVDLREVRFIDSTGMHAILGAQDKCAELGTEFFVIPSKSPASRLVFELAGVSPFIRWR